MLFNQFDRIRIVTCPIDRPNPKDRGCPGPAIQAILTSIIGPLLEDEECRAQV